jgi:allantoinase
MGSYAWPGNARVAVSIVVNVEEGAELNPADGDPIAEPVDELGIALKGGFRNFGNESNYRYGIECGGPRVLRLLAKHQVTATFTAAAQALERAPDLTAAIVAAGHEVCAHGWRWAPQHRFSEDEERAFIRKATESSEATAGTRPIGWLSRYLHTQRTRQLLAEQGYLYHMDDYGADAPFWDIAGGHPIVVVPYSLDTNDMKMWNAPALSPADWASYAIDTFEWLIGEEAESPPMMSLGLHLRIIGRPGRIGALDRVLAHVARHPQAWIATRRAIAQHFAAAVPPPQAERT